MKRVLIITNHRRDRSPGQRFRFEQYIDFLQNNGYSIDLSYFISENDDKFFYAKGHYLIKLKVIIKSYFIRWINLLRSGKYDIIFIFREALITRSILFEKSFSKRAKIIFDFDDSIWLPNVSEANKKYDWLKNPAKTAIIISCSHMIFAGNRYLADYASMYNNNVKIIPTTIDTGVYTKILYPEKKNSICIGWSGSVTTIQHFKFALPFLIKIFIKYPGKIKIKVIGDKDYRNFELNIKGISWVKADEIKELSEFDIGIMPLPDDEWAKGKCGLKGLQYMSLEIPTIMSPVGVNSEIIQDGINGFLAATEDEWIEKLSLLIEDRQLRQKLGKAGRQTVIEKYSVESQKQNYLDYFNELTASK